MTLNKSTLKVFGCASAALLGLGAILDAVGNSISLVKPWLTYSFTFFVIILTPLVHVWLKRYPLKVKDDDGRADIYNRINPKMVAGLIGMTALLWAPRFLGTATTDSQANTIPVSKEIEAKANQEGLPLSSTQLQHHLSLEVAPQPSNRSFKNLLLESSQELRSNREYLHELRAYIHNENRKLPIGSIKYGSTLSLLGDHYGRVTNGAYGEEKYIYQLALQLKNVALSLNGFRTREDYLRWNNTYEMTIDDVTFLCGFVFWYMAHGAKAELTPTLFRSLGWWPLSNEFVSAAEAPNLNMRYFTYEGKPVVDYSDYLSLID